MCHLLFWKVASLLSSAYHGDNIAQRVFSLEICRRMGYSTDYSCACFQLHRHDPCQHFPLRSLGMGLHVYLILALIGQSVALQWLGAFIPCSRVYDFGWEYRCSSPMRRLMHSQVLQGWEQPTGHLSLRPPWAWPPQHPSSCHTGGTAVQTALSLQPLTCVCALTSGHQLLNQIFGLLQPFTGHTDKPWGRSQTKTASNREPGVFSGCRQSGLGSRTLSC